MIIGAGLSGLATAGYLAKAGKKVKIVEKLPVVGGSTVPNKTMDCTVSMVCPITAKYAYGNANGWAKVAQDFDADVRMMNFGSPRIFLRGNETNNDMKIPQCLSPEGAARWLMELLGKAKPELISDITETELVKIMREMYAAPLEKLSVEWGELSPKEWIEPRTEDAGARYVYNLMMCACIFTGDWNYTYNYASAGKGMVLLRMWIAGDGLMSVPCPNPQEGIAVPIADAARKLGVEIELNVDVQQVLVEDGKVAGLQVKRGDTEEVLTADTYVVATRWGAWPQLFKPMPDFMAQIVGQIMQPEHMMGSAFKNYFLDDKIDLDGAFFMEFDNAGDSSHVLGGYAQSVEQPWNAAPGKQFIWAYRIMTAENFNKLGQDAVEKQMHEDMDRMFPGFSDHLIFETPFGGRLAPSHYFYNKQPKLQHHYEAIANLYFAGDCTTPMHSMLTDGAASTGEIVANMILK
ncbi:MAG: FAD-dependent oxidoreductase [Eubacteriales bacterium]|nr:FAD-dependent oxidoreductase [Eubacteriales bacterium]